jgi:hypothetical protein
MNEVFAGKLPAVSSPVELRLLSEYGAIFLTRATPPPTIIFADSEEVSSFQSRLETRSALLGDHIMELQAVALDSLLEAADRIRQEGGSITARAADSGRRSYDDTVRLWTRNVTRGLVYWEASGRLGARRASEILSLAPCDQVAVILDLEESEQFFFGTFFDKSILYSVAAPGASQHLAMLAFDVAEFEDERVESALGACGWFRTVPADFPHFTYLGLKADELPGLGLKKVAGVYKEKEYFFWIPDL